MRGRLLDPLRKRLSRVGLRTVLDCMLDPTPENWDAVKDLEVRGDGITLMAACVLAARQCPDLTGFPRILGRAPDGAELYEVPCGLLVARAVKLAGTSIGKPLGTDPLAPSVEALDEFGVALDKVTG